MDLPRHLLEWLLLALGLGFVLVPLALMVLERVDPPDPLDPLDR